MVWNVISRRKRIEEQLENEKPICSVRCKKKMIALTFDDGYKYTMEILEKLEQYDVRATFFLTGDWIEQAPTICRKVSEAGHEIGNHGFSHSDMTKQSQSDALEEINRMQKLIRETAGKECVLFRFPYGMCNEDLVKLVKKQGLNAIQWSISSQDWSGIDARTICRNVLKNEKLTKGAIVLLHTTHYETVKAVDQLIPALKAKGYQLVTVSDLLYEK